MRQPEVAGRLLLLALALALAAPVAGRLHAAARAAGFLAGFLDPHTPPAALVARRADAGIAGVVADRYVAPGLVPARPLVVVHGFTPHGKDDPRAVRAARLLARAGFAALVPTVPGLMRGRLRPEDVETVVSAVAGAGSRQARTAVVGVSVGAGPALLAAADPRVRDRVSAVVSLGGYADARALVRYFVTGDYEHGDVRGHVDHDPAVVRAFLDANADLLDAGRRRALGDPRQAARALADLPPAVEQLLDALSPLRVAQEIPGQLVLVHGRGDRAVPYTESLRLAAARPRGTRLVLLDDFGHVEGAGAPAPWRHADDVLALWSVVYRLLVVN